MFDKCIFQFPFHVFTGLSASEMEKRFLGFLHIALETEGIFFKGWTFGSVDVHKVKARHI